jgi:outer membrane protein assembly factor BamB
MNRCATLMATLALLALATTWSRAGDPAKVKHRVLVADDSTKRIAIVDAAGNTEWEYKIGPLHDLHMLPSGNVLFQLSWTRIVEMNPKTNKIVWEYDATTTPGNQGKRVEVHSFQRLADGTTLIAESGLGRLIEVDAKGKVVHEVPLKIRKPNPHTDTRLVRKLPSGNYLVCQEGDGLVREYDKTGTIVWEYEVPLFGMKPKGGHGPEAFGNQAFAAVRLANGNTLIATGNGHSVLEVTPGKEIVWSVKQNDLPGIVLAWVTTLQVLPNGNIVLGNCHAGPANPQIIEVTRDKKVVWTFQDFKRFGNSTPNSQVLDVQGDSIR